MSAKGKSLLRIGLAAVFLVAAVLACGPTPGDGAVSVMIDSPGDGGTVVVGQGVMIDSRVTAAAGVDRVDLSVDGQVVRHDTPPEGNPTEFRVSQLWTPTSEGRAKITVVAYDVNEASDEATITLQVVASGGAVPTVVPGATAVPTESTETPPPPVTTEAGCTLDSQYVADVTIPDGTVMSPGATFVKTWRVRNSGTCDWEPGLQLVFVSGEQMGGPASVSLPAVATGTETDISVSLVAPSSYGTHKGTWRVRSSDGTMFGTNLTIVIMVVSPVPTGAPTIAPTDAPPGATPVPIKPPPSPSPYTERVTREATYAGNEHAILNVKCPADSLVVGGGFSGGPDIVFHVSMISSHNDWFIDATNTSTSSKTVRVYAVCLHNAPGASVEKVQENTLMSSNDNAKVQVKCPADSIMTGGGWATGPNVHVYTSARLGGSEKWQVKAHNDDSVDRPLYVYAMCLTGSGGIIDRNSESASLPGGGTGKVEVTCPAGTIMTCGGFYDESAGDLSIHISSGPWGEGPDAEWRVYAVNNSTDNRILHGLAYCIGFP